MNQKTYLGASYLDVAKVAIETFMKVCRWGVFSVRSSGQDLVAITSSALATTQS